MKTGLTGLLGIDLPIVQAPVGGATSPQLYASVSNVGWARSPSCKAPTPFGVRSGRPATSRTVPAAPT